MKYRRRIATSQGSCLLLFVVILVILTTMNGCKPNAAKSTSDNRESLKLSVGAPSVQTLMPVDHSEEPNQPIVIDEPMPVASQSDIDEMIRLAAGPMADSVNSSLARLNTNLGRKEHTLVIMAMKSETRRWYFLTHMVSIIDKEQMQLATALIDSYSDTWQNLLDRRARILESEHEGERVQQLLDYNKVAALKLSRLVRQRILREILTPEQRNQYAAKFEKTPESESESSPQGSNDRPATNDDHAR